MRKIYSIKFCIIAVITLLFTSFLFSCDSEDGDWAPMKWNKESFLKGKTISVPANGGTYTLTCKNYSPWIASVTIGEEHFSPELSHVNANWIDVETKDHQLIITVKPVTAKASETKASMRSAEVCVTAGDIFDTFTIEQP